MSPFGYDTGYISGLKEMPYFTSVFGTDFADGTRKLSTSTDSLITSILSAGTFFGALLGSTIGDRFGRRGGIMIYVLIFSVGAALQTGTKNLAGFAVGRVLAGLGVGGTSCLIPVYQSECAPRHLRGSIVAAYQLCLNIGMLIAAVAVNATKDRPDASSYQIPVAMQFIWAAIIMVGLVFLPESPRWLLLKGRKDDCRTCLSKLLSEPLDGPNVTELFNEIQANLEHELEQGGASWADCFRNGDNKTFKRVVTGCVLLMLQQLSGINFIMYFGTTFFTNSGIKNPFIITIATNCVNAGMTVPGMWAVERIGRRPLLIYGAAGMAVCQLIVAAVGVATPLTNVVSQKVLVAFVCIFIGHFASTWGLLGWVLAAELPPYAIRTKSMSLSVATQWLFNFALGFATPYLVNDGPGNAGLKHNVFWIWGSCCVIGSVFAYYMIPETKGLSLEQIDILYRNSNARQSAAYRRYILETDTRDGSSETAVDAQKMEVKHTEQA
ncbi:Plasma membrane low glucose sensor [Vanrija albida]|uniref:Plasma membrane low glucose sensor n=1 Tax=Vanrija albida TaxID=181172 RepID=A0ABR3PQT0_9TREE